MKRVIEDSILHDIAKAIQEKNSTTETYQDVEMAQAVRDIQSGDDSLAIGLILRNLTEVVIPDGLVEVGNSSFRYCRDLKKVSIPESVTIIRESAFEGCANLATLNIPTSVETIEKNAYIHSKGFTYIEIPSNVKYIGQYAFSYTNATELYIHSGVETLELYAFGYNFQLSKMRLPNTLIVIKGGLFDRCSKLKEVDIEEGFNCNGLDLSASTLYSRETIVSWFVALYDRTGLETYKLIINKQSESLLSEEDLSIPINKNWTIVFQ